MDTATALKLAQLLQAKPNAPAVLNPGGRTVPNYGGAFSDTMRAVTTGRDINALEQKQQQEETAAAAANQQAIDQFTLPGGQRIDNVDGSPATPTAAASPQAVQDNADLRSVSTLGKPLDVQQALAKLITQRSNVPYGTQQVDALGRVRANNERQPGSSGGSSTARQLHDMYHDAYPDASEPELMDMVKRHTENFGVRDIAGVQNLVSSRAGVQGPLTNIGTVADNAGLVKSAEAGGSVSGKLETERFYDAPKAKVAVDGLIANNNETIAKAKQVRDDPALGKVTGLQGLLPSFWGGSAANVEASAESLKIALGFDRLQEMRNNSPSGGALGQVSEREGDWLQRATQSLAQSQSRQQFQQKLDEIISHMERVNGQVLQAYEAEYGRTAPRRGLPGATAPKPGSSGNDPLSIR